MITRLIEPFVASTSRFPLEDAAVLRAWLYPFVTISLLLVLVCWQDGFDWFATSGSLLILVPVITLQWLLWVLLTQTREWCSSVFGYCQNLSCVASEIYPFLTLLLLFAFAMAAAVVYSATSRLAGAKLAWVMWASELSMRAGVAFALVSALLPGMREAMTYQCPRGENCFAQAVNDGHMCTLSASPFYCLAAGSPSACEHRPLR